MFSRGVFLDFFVSIYQYQKLELNLETESREQNSDPNIGNFEYKNNYVSLIRLVKINLRPKEGREYLKFTPQS